ESGSDSPVGDEGRPEGDAFGIRARDGRLHPVLASRAGGWAARTSIRRSIAHLRGQDQGVRDDRKKPPFPAKDEGRRASDGPAAQATDAQRSAISRHRLSACIWVAQPGCRACPASLTTSVLYAKGLPVDASRPDKSA